MANNTNDPGKATILGKLGENSKNIMSIGALLFIVLPIVWWLIADNVRSVLRDFLIEREPEQCVVIPSVGHNIQTAPPGDWATVTWHNIERRSDCGVPELTAIVVNGDGIYHDVRTSTSGVMLSEGITPELSYKFQVPERAAPGRAWFRVTLDFPERGRTINTPRIFFTIPERASFGSPGPRGPRAMEGF
ncbi:hypothetical protein [Erythrobacter rubeus]|uniref:Uncharacterized protein n=1 Tax=Erythrobacter rubeus TaxID=2760803 RepID=A0ABR8KPS5_9SPHN|nr:hypothetical protein [Erythrobacter rubeus]MBD2842717.1 hypothetical protein [Erythrobacter rubeus]